jgi:hypothetical protein
LFFKVGLTYFLPGLASNCYLLSLLPKKLVL